MASCSLASIRPSMALRSDSAAVSDIAMLLWTPGAVPIAGRRSDGRSRGWAGAAGPGERISQESTAGQARRSFHMPTGLADGRGVESLPRMRCRIEADKPLPGSSQHREVRRQGSAAATSGSRSTGGFPRVRIHGGFELRRSSEVECADFDLISQEKCGRTVDRVILTSPPVASKVVPAVTGRSQL